MILPTILYTLKSKILLGLVAAVFTGIVITEVFLGQIIASLIAALPLCAGVFFVWRAQSRQATASAERAKEAALQRGEMAKALDGKLDKLMQAEKGISKAAGKEEERTESRAREGEAAIAMQGAPSKVEIVQPEDNPVPVKPK